MVFIPEAKIDEWISEDVPYIDLTTSMLGIGAEMAQVEYFTREDALLCGSEEAARVMARLNAEVVDSLPTGAAIRSGDTFFRARGRLADINMAAKVCQNLFDHASAIATKCRGMVARAQAVNPDIALVGTRKGFPGTKSLATKAMIAGGAYPHRLGLSETILIFGQHIRFCGGMDAFLARLPELKLHCFEKKLVVEAESPEDCEALCRAGIDGLQVDKFTPAQLRELAPRFKAIAPGVVILAAGGINEKNVEEYAACGADALVTTSFYTAKPIDIGAKITPVKV